MDEFVREILKWEFLATGSKVAILVEVAFEFPIATGDQRIDPNVKLPFID